jgi:hypothetical protein
MVSERYCILGLRKSWFPERGGTRGVRECTWVGDSCIRWRHSRREDDRGEGGEGEGGGRVISVLALLALFLLFLSSLRVFALT